MHLELEFRLEDFVLFEEYIGRSVFGCRLFVDSTADFFFFRMQSRDCFFGLGFTVEFLSLFL